MEFMRFQASRFQFLYVDEFSHITELSEMYNEFSWNIYDAESL